MYYNNMHSEGKSHEYKICIYPICNITHIICIYTLYKYRREKNQKHKKKNAFSTFFCNILRLEEKRLV